VVDHVSQVPLQKFIDAGIPFSLNSDDPSYFGAYLLDVYLAVHDAFKFSKDAWRKILLDSYENSWASEERKAELRKLMEGVFEQYKDLEL
jgi:adenosine deaminase